MLEEERKTKMKKTNRPTHETGTKFIHNNEKPSLLSLLLQNKNLNHDHHQFHILATFQQQQSLYYLDPSTPPQQPLQIPPLPNIHPQSRLLPNQKNLLIQPPLTLPPQLQIKIQQSRRQNQSHFIPSKILPRATSRTRTKRLKSLQMII